MAIDCKDGFFTLTTDHTAYQMMVGKHGYLLHLYYGAPTGCPMDYLLQTADRGFCPNPYEAGDDRSFSLDVLPQEYAAYGSGDYRDTCLTAVCSDGSSDADLRYESHRALAGVPAPEGLPSLDGEDAETLEITLRDGDTGLRVRLYYAVYPAYDAIARWCAVENATDGTVKLRRALSCALDFFCGESLDFISFYGRHAFERAVERTPVRHGKLVSDSLRGASSHQQNPFVIACESGADETRGRCWGMALVYSGGFIAEAECDQIDQTRLSIGIQPQGFEWTLAPGETFTTPQAVLIHSGEGLGALSNRYHRLYRERLCPRAWRGRMRPVLVNNWEATYFDFDDDKLAAIAGEAAQLGIGLLVVDDGWFGKRDSDTSGLGDWTVNAAKLRGGLGRLAGRVAALGMELGIWFEPEMISEDSALYRAHPEWTLRSPGRKGVRSRFQYVLDMTREDVRDYLFGALSAILSGAEITYVKWDMNRHLTNVYSAALPPERQGEVYHRYVLGLYDLLGRLTKAFPAVLFEGCSGGGGRFDAGMLYYSPQIWCSDDTDPIERIKIQYGTSFGYPVSAMGAHVSASPNHQTGRTTPFHTRGVVAMAGTFGYELDIGKLSGDEKRQVREQIAFYKEHCDVIQRGDYHRLTNPFENDRYAAWMSVAPDRSRALVSYVRLRPEANGPFVTLRLRGLDAGRFYNVAIEGESLGGALTGAALMEAGLPIPPAGGDYRALLIDIVGQ